MSKAKFNELLNNKRVIRIAVISAFAAILLIFITSYTDIGSRLTRIDPNEYSSKLKDQLLTIISKIDGVGEAEIFLTIDNSGENVYLTNSDTKTKSIEPTVRGVVVVCQGGDDPVVVSRVLSAVTRSLSISSDKVCITKLANV